MGGNAVLQSWNEGINSYCIRIIGLQLLDVASSHNDGPIVPKSMAHNVAALSLAYEEGQVVYIPGREYAYLHGAGLPLSLWAPCFPIQCTRHPTIVSRGRTEVLAFRGVGRGRSLNP